VLDNLSTENVTAVVTILHGATLLPGSIIGSQTIDSWGMGASFNESQLYISGSYLTGDILPTSSKPSSLLRGETWFTRAKPEYTSVLCASTFGVIGDGITDNTASINNALISAAETNDTLYFPAGVYAIFGTIFVPVGSRIVGESLPQFMASGDYFSDASSPQVMVRVGETGDIGLVEISDILFTVRGPTAGCVLLEWNIHESSQGSAAMWDSYFRIGGAEGSQLQAEDCPTNNTNATLCTAASLAFHMTPGSSGYFEATWIWVADHDIDSGEAQTQISIYAGRGALIESQGPTWLYGTASEHSILYQYQLSNASNAFLGHLQTETPYFQDSPAAPWPFGSQSGFPQDPDFSLCDIDTGCAVAWGLRVLSSTEVYIYGAGLYSFFNQGSGSCLTNEGSCQDYLIETSYSQSLWLYDIYTVGALYPIAAVGNVPAIAALDVLQGFSTEIAAWLPLALSGGNMSAGNPSDDNDIGGLPFGITPENVTILPLPCTTVAAGGTFTLLPECASGINSLPSIGPDAGSQNVPGSPADCMETCDFFRLITGTCCGQGGSLANPIIIVSFMCLYLLTCLLASAFWYSSTNRHPITCWLHSECTNHLALYAAFQPV